MYKKLSIIPFILILQLTVVAKKQHAYDTLLYRSIEPEIQKRLIEIRNSNYEKRMLLSSETEAIFDTLLQRKDSFFYPF
ncbi:MAG TPA: hypothetical protein PK990_09285, partial [Salinivirgaceae bacterium]|nr:hypothetical protein [Salinivirgaceae bacterium]